MSSNNAQLQPIKVILVTGASSGIGEVTAIEYAKLGYKVAITGRNEERLAKVLEQLVANSPSKLENDFLTIKADFEDPKQVDQVIDATISKFNQLDVLINNAGFRAQKLSLDHPDFFQDFQRILQVNLVAATRIAQLAVPHIKKTRGVIINVSSIADRLGSPSISYSVAKAGLSMLTKALANALDGTGVRVVTVSPGPVKTNFGPGLDLMAPLSHMHRIAESQEVADTIIFLSSEKASFIHATTIDVDGGAVTKFGGAFQRLAQGHSAKW